MDNKKKQYDISVTENIAFIVITSRDAARLNPSSG
jgi:hypothetical protein